MAESSPTAAGSGGSNSDSSSWVLSIEDAIAEEFRWFAVAGAANELRSTTCTIFRVPKHVTVRLDAKDLTYAPESISLGLFHRPGRYEAPKIGEMFKLKMASAFLATLFMREDRRKDSLARLATNPTFEQQISDLEGTRPNSEEGIKSKSNFESNGRTVTDRSSPKFGGVVEESSLQTRSVQVLKLGLRDHVWRDLCNEVVGGESGLRLAKQLYHLQDEDLVTDDESEEVIRCALTLDAITLATGLCIFYLGRDSRLFPFPLFRETLERGNVNVLKYHLDFFKLENQIPLCLLRRVMRILHDEDPAGGGGGGGGGESNGDAALSMVFAELTTDFSRRFLPGCDDALTKAYVLGLKEKGLFLNCNHILDCISLVLRVENERSIGDQKAFEIGVSSGVRVSRCVGQWMGRLRRCCFDFHRRARRGREKSMAKPRNFNIPSATRLHEAGIDFRHRPGFHNCDLLPVFKPGWFKARLYIPRLPRLSILTLIAWKNLVAYESRAVHSERKLECQFLAILGFMDCLIDTKEDVMLMTRGGNPVIPDRYSSSPEELARLFNKILIGFPVPEYPRWIALKLQIMKYHDQKWRRMILEVLRTNFSKPWLIISVIAASVLLVLTFLQTIYTMLAYYPSR